MHFNIKVEAEVKQSQELAALNFKNTIDII